MEMKINGKKVVILVSVVVTQENDGLLFIFIRFRGKKESLDQVPTTIAY